MIKRERNRVDKQESLKKKKMKGIQKKKLIDIQCESNVKTVVDKACELVNCIIDGWDSVV